MKESLNKHIVIKRDLPFSFTNGSSVLPKAAKLPFSYEPYLTAITEGIKTDYLWKQVLTRWGLTNIIENYA